MIDADNLWRSILQYAIQGKLVPQDPNDEPASILLDRINEEKQRLVKEGKIKNDKKESRIYRKDGRWYECIGDNEFLINPEIDMELPDGWSWARLFNIGYLIRGSGIKRNEVKPSGKPCIRYGELYTTYKLKTTEIVSHIDEDLFSKCKKITYGDAVLTLTGECKEDIGKTIVYLGSEEVACGGDLLLIKYHGLDPLFLSYLLNSPQVCLLKAELSNGDYIVHLGASLIGSILLPIPPLNEQKRIVAKIDELKPFVDKYKILDHERTVLDDSLSVLLRKSLLQYAIQGKLVPQDPKDEPASILLDRINEEKQRLVKEGKIKKDKKESRIYRKDGRWYEVINGEDERCIDDEIPFEIPDSWIWIRGISLFNKMKSTRPTGDRFRYIDLDSIDNINQKVESPKIIETLNAPSRATRLIVPGDVLFSMVRPYLKNIALVSNEYKDCIASTGFFVCNFDHSITEPEYIFNLMRSPFVVNGLNNFMKGENSPSICNKDIEYFLYPIPPIDEQKRIVAELQKIDSLIHRKA